MPIRVLYNVLYHYRDCVCPCHAMSGTDRADLATSDNNGEEFELHLTSNAPLFAEAMALAT